MFTLKEHEHFLPAESEMLEATAQYDFTARSSREVSFTAGSSILLYAQVSSDWWRGCVDGREGLVPDKYILIKIRLVFAMLC